MLKKKCRCQANLLEIHIGKFRLGQNVFYVYQIFQAISWGWTRIWENYYSHLIMRDKKSYVLYKIALSLIYLSLKYPWGPFPPPLQVTYLCYASKNKTKLQFFIIYKWGYEDNLSLAQNINLATGLVITSTLFLFLQPVFSMWPKNVMTQSSYL